MEICKRNNQKNTSKTTLFMIRIEKIKLEKLRKIANSDNISIGRLLNEAADIIINLKKDENEKK